MHIYVSTDPHQICTELQTQEWKMRFLGWVCECVFKLRTLGREERRMWVGGWMGGKFLHMLSVATECSYRVLR